MIIPAFTRCQAEISPVQRYDNVAGENQSLLEFVARIVATVIRLVDAKPELGECFAEWFQDLLEPCRLD